MIVIQCSVTIRVVLHQYKSSPSVDDHFSNEAMQSMFRWERFERVFFFHVLEAETPRNKHICRHLLVTLGEKFVHAVLGSKNKYRHCIRGLKVTSQTC